MGERLHPGPALPDGDAVTDIDTEAAGYVAGLIRDRDSARADRDEYRKTLAGIDDELRASGIEHPLGRAGVADLYQILCGAWEARDEAIAEADRAKGDRAALAVAVTGLRELETTWANDAEAIESADALTADVIRGSRQAVSALLDKIGATR